MSWVYIEGRRQWKLMNGSEEGWKGRSEKKKKLKEIE